jgi:CHASE2 domain-containing sensor protein
MADKGNTFIEIWSGDKLVDIILPEPSTTTAKSPTPLDRELVKVFQDRRNLLAACKATLEDLQIASETYETCHEEPGFRSGLGRNPADLDVTLETQDQLKAAITMAEKGE